MIIPPYKIIVPELQSTPVVFSSPHSGRHYPADFLQNSLLDATDIRSSEDAFVDQLIEGASAHGATMICATYPRAYLDLNRRDDELDPALIEGVAKPFHNLRIASGLGVIPRVVAGARTIQRGKLSLSEAQARIDRAWHPYHNALRGLIDATHMRFGQVLLLDMHSMPQGASQMTPKGQQIDIILGDRFGSSAGADLSDFVSTCFVQAGLTVARNVPFAGAYITHAYGKPAHARHALQIEINRALYLDEAKITPNVNFMAFKQTMTQVIGALCQYGCDELSLAGE